jgi:hypothetical protein
MNKLVRVEELFPDRVDGQGHPVVLRWLYEFRVCGAGLPRSVVLRVPTGNTMAVCVIVRKRLYALMCQNHALKFPGSSYQPRAEHDPQNL